MPITDEISRRFRFKFKNGCFLGELLERNLFFIYDCKIINLKKIHSHYIWKAQHDFLVVVPKFQLRLLASRHMCWNK